MDSRRSPLAQHLWDLGVLDSERQAAVDRLQWGPSEGLPPCTIVTFDPPSHTLTVRTLAEPLTPRHIPLPKPPGDPAPLTPDLQPHLALFDTDHRKLGDFALDDVLGLVKIDQQVYRYSRGFRQAANLAPTSTALAAASADTPQGYGPCDLSFSPFSNEALIIDRGTGILQHVEIALGHVGHQFRLRSRHSATTLNVAWHRHRFLVTDGRTVGLTICDPFSGEAWPSGVNLGIIGNLLLASDGLALYVLSLHPVFALHELDPDTFEPLRRFDLKGKPFSANGMPTDHLALSPDGQHLFALSYVDLPVRGTPVLNVIDLASGQVGQRYRLKPDRKPTGLAFGVKNPVYCPPVSLEQAVVHLGYLSAEAMAEIKRKVAAETNALVDAAELARPQSLAELAGGYSWRRTRVEPAPHLHLPTQVTALIADYLAMRFHEETKQVVKEHEAAWNRVIKASEHVRQELESFTGVEVTLLELVGPHPLVAFIGRELVEEWLPMLEHDDMLKGVVVQTVPHECPDCHTPLFGVFTCPACGFEVLVNTRGLHEPRTLSPATIHPHGFLPPDHLLLTDPHRRRLIQLDHERQVFWELQADERHQDLVGLLRFPVDALRLPNRHTLIADARGARVFEVTRLGRPYWEWPAAAGKLQEPVRLARSEWGDTYVCDRKAHRIWRIDAQGQPRPGYGEEEGYLNQPTDVQVLHDGNMIIVDSGNKRVIEVCEGFILWQLGGKNGVGPQLQEPLRAVRFENGLTLVLDAGNHKILAVNQEGEVVWSHDTILNQSLPPVARPKGMVTLPEGRIAYWDYSWLVEIDHRGNLLWSTPFEQISEHPHLIAEGAEGRENADARLPRRLWRVQRLDDGDPGELAIRRAEEARLKQARALREVWRKTRQEAIIKLLRLLSKQRLAEFAIRAKQRWRPRPLGQAAPAALAAPAAPPPPQDPPAAAVPSPPTAMPQRPALPASILTVERNSDSVIWVVAGKGVRWIWGQGILKRPRAAELLPNGHVLVTDTMNHRIVEVDPANGHIVWEVGRSAGLQYPRFAKRLEDGHTLIADTGNRRVVEVTPEGDVFWQWNGFGSLKTPNACERLANGHTLVTDWHDHVVLEIDLRGDIAWWYGEPGESGSGNGLLFYPEQAMRVAEDRTLVVDSHNHRLIEVNAAGKLRWDYRGEADYRLTRPTQAVREADGTTLVVHRYGRAVAAIDAAGTIAWRTTLPLKL